MLWGFIVEVSRWSNKNESYRLSRESFPCSTSMSQTSATQLRGVIAGSLGEGGWPRISLSLHLARVCVWHWGSLPRWYYLYLWTNSVHILASLLVDTNTGCKEPFVYFPANICWCICMDFNLRAFPAQRGEPRGSKYLEICMCCRTPSPDHRGRWVPATGQRNKWPSQGPQSNHPHAIHTDTRCPPPFPYPSPSSRLIFYPGPETIVTRRRKFLGDDLLLWRYDTVAQFFYLLLLLVNCLQVTFNF